MKIKVTVKNDEDRTCKLGDLILTSKNGLKNVLFLGANKISGDEWKCDFLLNNCKIADEDSEWKNFKVNSDAYVNYSASISIGVKINEHIKFNDDLGYYVRREKELKGLSKKSKVDDMFCFVEAITIYNIDKDSITFRTNFK